MLSKFFNRKPTPPARAQAPAPAAAAHDPYEYMSNEQARATMLTAVLKDDLGVAKSIARHHAGCVDWAIVAKGSAVGSAPMTTPLVVYAAGSNSLRVLQWMIDQRVSLEARSNILNQTALYHASEQGAREAVEMLVQAGADPNTRAEVRSPITAVQAARSHGHEDIARLLESHQHVKKIQPRRADTQDSLSLREERTISAPKVVFRKG